MYIGLLARTMYHKFIPSHNRRYSNHNFSSSIGKMIKSQAGSIHQDQSLMLYMFMPVSFCVHAKSEQKYYFL